MRFASCAHDGRRFAALIDGDVVRPLRGIEEFGPDTPTEVLADPPLSEERQPLSEVKLLPVLWRDGDRVVVEIECVGRLENSVAAERPLA